MKALDYPARTWGTSLAVMWAALLAIALATVLAACQGERADGSSIAQAAITHRTLGLAYLEEDRLAEAEAEFRSLIEIAPQEVLGHANVGLVQLRRGQYADAEESLRQALSLDPGNSDVHLLLAHVYIQSGRGESARRQLEAGLEGDRDHVRTLYVLADLIATSAAESELESAAQALARAVALAPANLALRLYLVETQLRTGKADQGLLHLEEVRRQSPGPSPELEAAWEEAIAHLRARRAAAALPAAMAVHNLLKPSPLYQAGIFQLRGRGTETGWPLVSLGPEIVASDTAVSVGLIRFRDVTAALDLEAGEPVIESGLEFFPKAADTDGDGDVDLIILGVPGDGAAAGRVLLLRNDDGTFVDAEPVPGLSRTTSATTATFGDYDNDGRLDLYLGATGADILLRSLEDGGFENVTGQAGLEGAGAGTTPRDAVFGDFDHDGDLDLFVAGDGPNRLHRNDGNGTFSRWPDDDMIAGVAIRSTDLAYADFDDDAALDLLVVNEDGPVQLLRNLRQGRFRDVAAASSLTERARFAAVADHDNDGDFDLLLGTGSHRVRLLRNSGDGVFAADPREVTVDQALDGLKVRTASFLDFDNDGRLDLIAGGAEDPDAENRGAVRLLRNEGEAGYRDVSFILPDDLEAISALTIADFDRDGDVDIATGGPGGVRILRNDGGNMNGHIGVQLVGLSTGNSKTNHFGFGAKLDMWADGLHQTRVVTEAATHFGLGDSPHAEVLRVQWTNGVPQNSFLLGADQFVVEEQVLKGSCAFLYASNGDRYEFVTDMMWKSALGMPLGIMTESANLYAPPDASREHLRIPGSALQPRDGVYSLQITEELWEVAYLDALKLIALDHPDSVSIWVDERFVPPYVTAVDVYPVGSTMSPLGAWDDRGRDVLPLVRDKDDVYVSNLVPGRYQGLTREHDLVLDFGSLDSNEGVILFLNGWLYPTDASINVALGQNSELSVLHPFLQVPTASGEWVTVVENLSFPQGKNKTVAVDLRGAFPAEDYRVRIRTNMEIYWDHIFWAKDVVTSPMVRTELRPTAADLHFRGFSRLYRKGGRYGPHWFDYGEISAESPWRPMEGTYTRYGDVRPLLEEADDMYVIVGAGDELTVEFDATAVPGLAPGWRRTFLIFSDGFLKDADLNTLSGNRVEPLPFHGMTRYPYGTDERYPTDEAHREFRDTYLTRSVP